MNALEVINAARAILASTGTPTHNGDTLTTDASGRLKAPTDPKHYVIHTILGTPTHEWGQTTHGTVRIQVNAFSIVEGEPLAMLATASPLLAAARFIPGALTSLGRDGPYTGYAQAFERTT